MSSGAARKHVLMFDKQKYLLIWRQREIVRDSLKCFYYSRIIRDSPKMIRNSLKQSVTIHNNAESTITIDRPLTKQNPLGRHISIHKEIERRRRHCSKSSWKHLPAPRQRICVSKRLPEEMRWWSVKQKSNGGELGRLSDAFR